MDPGNSLRSNVGAAEGCDILTVVLKVARALKIKIKR
jgi:hypothetical protein